MRIIYFALGVALVACTAEQTKLTDDFGFDGTCVNCHAGLSALHVHSNYKLRCVDCHGGNDQIAIDPNAFKDPKKFRDAATLAKVHVLPKKGLSRFFFANGVDDDGDGVVDNPTIVTANADKVTFTIQPGESYEPQLHGEGPGEFVDDELQRDLNYTRFLNPGDLRIATIGCGASNRAAGAGGNGSGCHQATIDVVRRSIMVNQSAVTNGAYYGNESWRQDFITQRGNTPDPRAGAFSYALDYQGADSCVVPADPNDTTGRAQP
ncbi:MAG TPA: hypothetical protein VGO00_09375, partial [Kofleriaceae bacterium]|nr:hypothetical protein [Kofleriaceae bacterium]